MSHSVSILPALRHQQSSAKTTELSIWQPQPGLYFLAEASINDDILALAEGQPDSRLYWGALGQTHASVSPYLLPLNDWQSFAEQVAHLDDWGIVIRNNVCSNLTSNNLIIKGKLRAWMCFIKPH